ncbi:hypothetical protein BJ138DRAFT_594364 [Hygrophoropsis aurantiaca]|uniref:Uncharacterized protein n=1 Tax=Hygrophoropsis aurantiaca TaxID=72124 RepID=A0ACB8ARV1_9AGAM|nr:hypothetical protein BJ138DRAFT_594364 [Hygrophoropsis aurantiaca]
MPARSKFDFLKALALDPTFPALAERLRNESANFDVASFMQEERQLKAHAKQQQHRAVIPGSDYVWKHPEVVDAAKTGTSSEEKIGGGEEKFAGLTLSSDGDGSGLVLASPSKLKRGRTAGLILSSDDDENKLISESPSNPKRARTSAGLTIDASADDDDSPDFALESPSEPKRDCPQKAQRVESDSDLGESDGDSDESDSDSDESDSDSGEDIDAGPMREASVSRSKCEQCAKDATVPPEMANKMYKPSSMTRHWGTYHTFGAQLTRYYKGGDPQTPNTQHTCMLCRVKGIISKPYVIKGKEGKMCPAFYRHLEQFHGDDEKVQAFLVSDPI